MQVQVLPPFPKMSIEIFIDDILIMKDVGNNYSITIRNNRLDGLCGNIINKIYYRFVISGEDFIRSKKLWNILDKPE